MRRGYIGYGELGRQVAALAEAAGGRSEHLYFDDECHRHGMPGAHPFASYAEERFGDVAFHVCLGYKHLKKKRRLSGTCGPWGASCRWWCTRQRSSIQRPG